MVLIVCSRYLHTVFSGLSQRATYPVGCPYTYDVSQARTHWTADMERKPSRALSSGFRRPLLAPITALCLTFSSSPSLALINNHHDTIYVERHGGEACGRGRTHLSLAVVF